MANTLRKSLRIRSDKLAAIAAVGVSRALAARHAQMQELDTAQIESVSGGLPANLRFDIAGGRLMDILSKSVSMRQEVADVGAGSQDLNLNVSAGG